MEPKKDKPEKGKSRETTHQNDQESTSLPSRIASSAAGLARDLIGTPSGSEVQGQLASASGLSSKLANGSSSSTNQSLWSESRHSHPSQQSTNGPASVTYAFRNDDTFRNAPNRHAQDEEFNDFLNGTKLNNPDAWNGDSQIQSDITYDISQHTAGPVNPWPNSGSQHQGYDDGAEVRMLLSDPSFQASWEESEVMAAGPLMEQTAMDLFGDAYTSDEQRAADRIRNALPSPPVHAQVSPLSPMNLRPDFESIISHKQSEVDSEEISNIERLNTPQREQLLLEWNGVLNGYTDEVWGDMLPAVQAARSQLQEVKAGSERLDSKAIIRLKMILGHVTQSADPAVLHARTSFVANPFQDEGQRYETQAGMTQLGTNTMGSTDLSNAQKHGHRN